MEVWGSRPEKVCSPFFEWKDERLKFVQAESNICLHNIAEAQPDFYNEVIKVNVSPI